MHSNKDLRNSQGKFTQKFCCLFHISWDRLYSVSETPFEQKWAALSKFLNEWYEKPDLNSLRIILCAYIAHLELTDPPIYLFVNGAPGSGKTEIAIRAIEWLKHVHSISELSSNSFLSGFGEKSGILDNLKGGHGVLTFPDFNNTILTQDPIMRMQLVGQLRRIYDGKFDKKVGNKAKVLTWKGKVSCIAAVTPNIEEFWALTRDLGERWLTVQWTSPDADDYIALRKYATKSRSQIANKPFIHAEYKKHILGLFTEIGEGATPNLEIIDSLALIVEISRVNVIREYERGKYVVVGKGQQQSLSRVAQNLAAIIKGSTALRNSDKIEDIDIRLAMKLALDSIPHKRMNLIKHLVNYYPTPLTSGDLLKLSKVSKASYVRTLADIRALDIVKPENKQHSQQIALTLEELTEGENVEVKGKEELIVLKPSFYKLLEEANVIKFIEENY